MKILILSCNTGEGHNSSGKALKAALTRKGVNCDIIDTLSLKSESLSKAVSDLYEFSIKIGLFGLVYRFAQWYSSLQFKWKSPVYLFCMLFAKRLAHIIEDGDYDGVICVHLFPAEAITRIRRKYGQYVPSIFVMTDYTCIPILYETELDKYIIPHYSLTSEFVQKGLIRNKLQAIGIPVNEKTFTTRWPKAEAREFLNILYDWKEAKGKWYLVMGGSMGFGNIIGLIKELESRIGRHDRIICICGKNDKLKRKISRKFSKDSSVKALGYTDKVSMLMDASDVLMTKPGGITSTEAIIKNIPLVHISPIKGLEEDNAAFFREMCMSVGGMTVREQAEAAVELSHNDIQREEMMEIQRENCNPDCSNEIADIIIRMTH